MNNKFSEMIYKYSKIENTYVKMKKEHLEVNRNDRYL